MNSNEAMPILEFIFDNIHCSKKWESFFAVPFQTNDNYDQLQIFFEDFPNIPFTTIDGNYIDFVELIRELASLVENQPIFISVAPVSNFEDNIIGLKIDIDSTYKKFTIDSIRMILSAITKHEVTISDQESQNFEGIIKVENGNELLVFSFDFDSFSINGYTSKPQDLKYSFSISFLAKCNFFENFYNIVSKIMINMIYFPNKALNISLGSNSILFNIPKTQNRFNDFANYLFPQSTKHIYSHTEKSEELNAISTATIIYLVKPTDTLNNNSSVANRILQATSSNNSQQGQNSKTYNSIFMFFTFVNGVPLESNCHFSLEILSSISWSDLSISFIPMPLNAKINEKEKNDFLKNIENASQIPYCTYSSIVGKPGTVIMAFLNTTKESAQAISRVALIKAFEKMQNLLTKKKSFVRLNRIWESIDTISCSLSSICGDKSVYQEAWNGCCSVLTESYRKQKNNQKILDEEPESERVNSEIEESRQAYDFF